MRKYFVIISLFASMHVLAQSSQYTQWIGVQLPVAISKKWQWHNDIGYRTLGFSFKPQQDLYRTGIRRIVNNNLSYAAGVAFFFTRIKFDKNVKEFGDEFRLWQELLIQKKIQRKLLWISRCRTEERWFDATSKANAYFAFRYRYRTALQKELNKHWEVSIADEYMLQYAKGNNSFNQNRTLATIMYHLNKSTVLQTGYMYTVYPTIRQHSLLLLLQKNI